MLSDQIVEHEIENNPSLIEWRNNYRWSYTVSIEEFEADSKNKDADEIIRIATEQFGDDAPVVLAEMVEKGDFRLPIQRILMDKIGFRLGMQGHLHKIYNACPFLPRKSLQRPSFGILVFLSVQVATAFKS